LVIEIRTLGCFKHVEDTIIKLQR